mmetsp:Transcript_20832/g.26914  ORF Transcript_20832/g.26914 Transcript_20832/m.26914 type:complete len:190 (+) Transcript_20832:462-1031(+)
MKRFLDAQMPDFVEKIKDASDFAKYEEKGKRNNLPRVLLFSSKPNTSPLTKYLSVEFRRRILLAEIKPNKKNQAILEKYGVTKLPALIVIPPSTTNEEGEDSDPIPIVYDGDGFSRHKLTGFLSKHSLKDPVTTVKKKEETTTTEKATEQSQAKKPEEEEEKSTEQSQDKKADGENEEKEPEQKVHSEL